MKHKIGDLLKTIKSNTLLFNLRSENFKMDNIIGTTYFDCDIIFRISNIKGDDIFIRYNDEIYLIKNKDVESFFKNIRFDRRKKIEKLNKIFYNRD